MNFKWRAGYRKQWRWLSQHPLHPSAQRREFTEYEAMLDILDQTAGIDMHRVIDRRAVLIPKGYIYISQRRLQTRWQWKSLNRVRRLIEKLVEDGFMRKADHLTIQSKRAGVIYEVLAYDDARPKLREEQRPPQDQTGQRELSFNQDSGSPEMGSLNGSRDCAKRDHITSCGTREIPPNRDHENLKNGSLNGSLLKKVKERKRRGGACAPNSPDLEDQDFESAFLEVLSYYNKRLELDAKATNRKREMIFLRLETYSVKELKQAIDGIAVSRWHTGKDDGEKKLRFGLMFGADEKVDYLRTLAPRLISNRSSVLDEPLPLPPSTPEELELAKVTNDWIYSRISKAKFQSRRAEIELRMTKNADHGR